MEILDDNSYIEHDLKKRLKNHKIKKHKLITFITMACMILIIVDFALILNFANLLQKIQL